MTNFLGELEVSVDNKGRFLLPSAFRKQLEEGVDGKFVINRGFENCLTIYPIDSWKVVYEKIVNLDEFNSDDRKFRRLFLNGATNVELDSADRLLLPKQLMEQAGITKDAVLTAAGNKLELWDKDTYYSYLNENKDDFSNLADRVTKGKNKKTEEK